MWCKVLGIFGSYARHQANAESDIDIFFETEAPNLFKTARLREELELLLGLPVDLVRLRDSMNPRLKSSIKVNAYPVHANEGRESENSSRNREKTFMPRLRSVEISA